MVNWRSCNSIGAKDAFLEVPIISPMTTCLHYKVSGRVQGVGFRASARAQALSLGLSGWARNCADGGVEVMACGLATQLEALHHWLHSGPPQAQVTAVTQSPAPFARLDGFDIR